MRASARLFVIYATADATHHGGQGRNPQFGAR